MASKNSRNDWLKYNQAIKEKRTKKTTSKEKTQRKFQGNFLTIQRLSPDVSGRAQKFARDGPREFVPIDSSQDVTLENIKRACEDYFESRIGPNLTM
ncbi:hypothetical protein QZH41_002627 [Actinostola sp. cb2023]|nr:hypothetical protein QZH41_002627 [Actinostola sp. cb2023]